MTCLTLVQYWIHDGSINKDFWRKTNRQQMRRDLIAIMAYNGSTYSLVVYIIAWNSFLSVIDPLVPGQGHDSGQQRFVEENSPAAGACARDFEQ